MKMARLEKWTFVGARQSMLAGALSEPSSELPGGLELTSKAAFSPLPKGRVGGRAEGAGVKANDADWLFFICGRAPGLRGTLAAGNRSLQQEPTGSDPDDPTPPVTREHDAKERVRRL